MSVVRLSAEAVDEIGEAAAWYRSQRQGLENDFLVEIERLLPLIGQSPLSFPRLMDLPEDLGIRRALLPRFPYGVVFMNLQAEVRVLAVAHLRRRPDYWLNRIATD